MTTPLRDSIIQTCNIWLSGLCGSGYLYGAWCELLAEENPLTNLLAGHITLHIYNTPPVPAQRIDVILEYDVSYIEAMTFNIQFSSVTDAAVELGANEWHDVSLYAADQYFDSVNRREEIEQNKFDLSIRPTETRADTIATASAADASGVYSVCKCTVYKNGDKVTDIDQFGQVHEVNHVDCATAVRKSMGMMY